MDNIKGGYIEGAVSIAVNVFLFIIKFWVGIITNSIALTADAWHTASDAISSVVVVIAAKLASRKPNKKHPYGYGRWEQIAGLFIAFILGIIAFEFLRTAILEFRTHTGASFGVPAVVVTIISIVVKFALAIYAFYIGKKSGNSNVRADGWHHLSDSLSSIAVLIGIICYKYFDNLWWMDSVLGIFVALMLFHAVYEIGKEAIRALLGEDASPGLIAEIGKEITGLYGSDLMMHHFHFHDYNLHKEITFHIRLDGDTSLSKSHAIATEIETLLLEKCNMEATIHIEPIENDGHGTN